MKLLFCSIVLSVLSGAAQAVDQHNVAGPVESNRVSPPACKELSMRAVYNVIDNGGQEVLTVESATDSCMPAYSEKRTTIKDHSGKTLRFSGRTARVGGTALSSKDSWFELEFPDGSVLSLVLGEPVIEAGSGLRVDYPGSRFSYGGKELRFDLEKPKKPVFWSKDGKAFRARLPEDVSEIMQNLEDAGRALADAGLFAGIDGLLVDLYLGVESQGPGRKGFEVIEVERQAKRGLGHFYKKEDPSQKAPPSAAPAKDSTSGEPVGLPDPVPTATEAAPTPDAKPPAERPVPGSPEVAPASPPGRDGND